VKAWQNSEPQWLSPRGDFAVLSERLSGYAALSQGWRRP